MTGSSPTQRAQGVRLQAGFLRHFARSGSVTEAAAQAGITPRTVQRWRLRNPAFARRYSDVLASRVEILEDLAMRRACSTERRTVFHRGRQVATVERHNDTMLMRVLARFDKARVRERAWINLEDEIERRVERRLSQMSRSTRQATATRIGG